MSATAVSGAAEPVRLPHYLRPHTAALTVGVLLLLGTNGLEKSIPWLLSEALDALRAGHISLAQRCALGVLGVAVVLWPVRTWSRVRLFNIGRDVEFSLRRDFLAAVHRLRPNDARRAQSGDLVSRATSDIGQVRFLVGFGVLNLCNAILAYAITLTLMLQISVKLTFLALMPLPILVLATQRLGRAVHRRSLDSQTQAAALSQVAHESLSRVRVLRAGALEAWAESRFHACNDAVVQANMRLVVLRGIMWPLFASLGALGVLVTLWFGGRMVIEGELSVGRFAAFHAYLAQLTWPTLAFGYLVTVVQRGRASFSRLQGLLQPEGGRASPGAETLPPASSATTLTSVLPPPATITVAAPPRPAATSMNEPPRSAATSLSAPPLLAVEGLHVDIEGRTLLRDLHLQLTAGARVAIVGRAGAGKSLLAAAITGMLPSTRGQIRWQTRAQAGKANAAGPDNSTAPRCILAPQEPFLFSRSIADNIAFGAGPDVDAAAIAAAAARAHVADEIAAMPEAYDTQVGERGVQLSGGQRQRIALARVLLSQPALWVLDDPLSAVDPHTEACILAALWQHRPGVSLIYLSQRLNAAALADHVWLLDQGRLVDSGSHTDLLTRSPLYQRLAQDSHSP